MLSLAKRYDPAFEPLARLAPPRPEADVAFHQRGVFENAAFLPSSAWKHYGSGMLIFGNAMLPRINMSSLLRHPAMVRLRRIGGASPRCGKSQAPSTKSQTSTKDQTGGACGMTRTDTDTHGPSRSRGGGSRRPARAPRESGVWDLGFGIWFLFGFLDL